MDFRYRAKILRTLGERSRTTLGPTLYAARASLAVCYAARAEAAAAGKPAKYARHFIGLSPHWFGAR